MTSPRLRTCIATRKQRPDSEMLRLVLDRTDSQEYRVMADPKRCLPGRGAWLTPDLRALELAERQRAFARAFRTSVQVDTRLVRQFLESLEKTADNSTRQDGKRKTEH